MCLANPLSLHRPFDVHTLLNDPYNHDFRPCKGTSHGAYPSYLAAPYYYDIPGRQEWRASVPIPFDGSAGGKLDSDLMFLPALGATYHAVYLGEQQLGAGATGLPLVANLSAGANVVTNNTLKPSTAYTWRVDAQVDGHVHEGQTWQFTTLPASSHFPDFAFCESFFPLQGHPIECGCC